MYVTNSGISMSSGRKYQAKSAISASVETRGKNSGVSSFSDILTNPTISETTTKYLSGSYQYEGSSKEGESDDGQNSLAKNDFGSSLMDRWNMSPKAADRVEAAELSPQENLRNLIQIRIQSVNYLLELLFGKNTRTETGLGNILNGSGWGNNSNLISGKGSGISISSGYSLRMSSAYTYEESETTDFKTVGQVVTSDGRSINFNLSLTMSRSFKEESQTIINFNSAKTIDPLVINLDSPAVSLSDQNFYFDLDADGHKECISRLDSGCGYLALDKNGNGTIDDGSELFGTKSGDGFTDLAKYDSDGNGWIDEADPIFDKLMVWTMGENGKESLTAIGKAGVGAIYLGSSSSEFSIKDEGNETRAAVKKTGLFLYESGQVGSLQQVDMAVYSA